MLLLLIFAVTLLVAVLVSELAQRSILSTAILFLLAGIGLGSLKPQLVPTPPDPIISRFIELALFSVLFTDGMKVGFRDPVSAWRLPGRGLLGELGLGLLLGAIIPWSAIILGRSRFFSRASTYEPLYGFAMGLLVLALAWLTDANLFWPPLPPALPWPPSARRCGTRSAGLVNW